MVIDISGKDVFLHNIDGKSFENKYGHKCPIGVRGRNSDNRLYKKEIGWSVSEPLYSGIEKTYKWIEGRVKEK